MLEIETKGYVFGSIFALANHLQILGNNFDTQITVKQWLLMAVISKHENKTLSIGELAKQVGNSHQNVKKMAVILEKQGFIAMQKDPRDARAVLISLTPKCDDYFKRRADAEIEFLEALFTGFDDETLKGLIKGISLLAQNILVLEREDEEKRNQ